jgi:hypothetical protein
MSISIRRFRKLYKEGRVTKQKMSSRLGGKKLPSYKIQMEKITELQNRVQSLQAAGYEVL